jgi:hypothetical protein
MNAPHGRAEVRKFYGDVKIERDPRGGWRIANPAGWESANCEMLRGLPGLPHVNLFVHRAVAGPLVRALTSWQAQCPEYAIDSIGCFNPRPKRTSSTTADVVGWEEGLSLHTVAAAIDFNAVRNPMKKPLTTDMPPLFVDCFVREGFTWGGMFPTPDPMHMQYASGI